MDIEIRGGLPFTRATLTFQGRRLEIDNVLIDTGSAGCIFQADRLLDAAVRYEPTDVIREIREPLRWQVLDPDSDVQSE